MTTIGRSARLFAISAQDNQTDYVSSAASVQPEVGDLGPLMTQLMAAQKRDDHAATQVPLRRAARLLARFAVELGQPWLEPVSPGGHRLVGAALALDGSVRLRPGGMLATGQALLLVEGVAVTPLSIAQRADQLRVAGATSIWVFAVEAPDLGSLEGVNGYRVLSQL